MMFSFGPSSLKQRFFDRRRPLWSWRGTPTIRAVQQESQRCSKVRYWMLRAGLIWGPTIQLNMVFDMFGKTSIIGCHMSWVSSQGSRLVDEWKWCPGHCSDGGPNTKNRVHVGALVPFNCSLQDNSQWMGRYKMACYDIVIVLVK